MKRRLAFALLLALPLAAPAQSPHAHRIAIDALEVHGDVTESVRAKLRAEIRAAITRDGRAVVMDHDEEVRTLIEARARVQKVSGVFDATTAPKSGMLAAANYKLKVSLFADSSRRGMAMELVHIETGYTVGSSTTSDVNVAVGEILNFIPRSSPLPSGWITVEVQPGQAMVKFLDESEERVLPLRRLERRPGRYAVAILPFSEDYEPAFPEVRVEPAKEQLLRVVLQRKRVTVTLPQMSPGAALYFDGQYMRPDVREIKCDAGKHQIVALEPDGTLQLGEVDAGVGKPNRASFELSSDALRREAEMRHLHETVLPEVPTSMTSSGYDVAVLAPGRVSVLDVLTGNERWPFAADGFVGTPVILRDRIIVTRRFREVIANRGGSTTRAYSAILQLDRSSGNEVEPSQQFDSAEILDSNADSALFVGNGNLQLIHPPAKVSKLHLDPRARSESFDVNTARLGGSGIVAASRDRRTLHSYYLDGQLAWSARVDDAVSRVFTRGDDLLVMTEGKRLLHLRHSTGELLWERPLQPVAKFARFAGGEVLLVSAHGDLARVSLTNGEAVRSRVALGDLDVITGCGQPEGGRLLVVVADHRVAIVNIATAKIEWQSDFDERVVWAGSDHGFAAAATTDARIQVFAVSARSKALGWIAAVDGTRGTINVATSLPSLAAEHLRAFSLADYLQRNDGGAVDIAVASPLAQRNGVVTVPVADARPLQPGQVIVRGGALKIETEHPDVLVWVDGWFECRGGCLISDLAEGRHEVVAARHHFEPYRASVTIGSEVAVIHPVVDRTTEGAMLVVDSEPRGADVFIGSEYVGNTGSAPVKWKRVSLGQWTDVRVQKDSYETEQKRIEQSESTVTKQFNLRQAAPLVEIFLGAVSRTEPLLGWSADAITHDGVVGPPLRKASAAPPLFAHLSGQYAIRNLAGFGFAEFGTGAKRQLTAGGGLRWIARALPYAGEVTIGAEYMQFPSSSGSNPPSVSSGRGTREDRSAPLEQWHHPIPNVLVDNSGSSFLGASLTLRPQSETFVKLTAGKVMGERYRGTVLVTDPASGHLVLDSSRAYDLRLQSGSRLRLEVETLLGLLIRRETRLRYMLYGRYEQNRADFGVFTDQWQQFAFGLGVVFYQLWGR